MWVVFEGNPTPNDIDSDLVVFRLTVFDHDVYVIVFGGERHCLGREELFC